MKTKEDKIRRLGIKIARKESDKLHDKQFKKRFKKYEYGDFIDGCLNCFIEGYKFGRLKWNKE